MATLAVVAALFPSVLPTATTHESTFAPLRSKQGIALYYAPGVFERVLRVRARQGYTVRYDVAGYTASTNCADIGKVVLISVNGHPYRRYQVMDCSQPRHRAGHIARGIVAELDWRSAVREGISRSGRGNARVFYY